MSFSSWKKNEGINHQWMSQDNDGAQNISLQNMASWYIMYHKLKGLNIAETEGSL